MAVRPGEENVATLFGDVHYWYGPATADPPHHRFDKGSYVYLFEHAGERRARIEVANRVGTHGQDAFDGSLDKVHVTYSYRHHCMVSLAVGDVDGHDEWHLPTYDPRNEHKYHYKLDALDIYFWTQDDALAFVNGVRRVLPPTQVDVQDEPAPPPQHQHQHQPAVSSVVQRLESVAISDAPLPLPLPPPPPGQPPAANTSTITNTTHSSFAPPPNAAVPPATTASPAHSAPPAAATASSFAPIPYNPAAPAAPEAHAHREKTPPPEDDDDDANSGGGYANPLHQRLAIDAGLPFSPGLVPPSGAGMMAHRNVGPLSPGVPPPQFAHPPGAPQFPGPPVGTPGFAPPGFTGGAPPPPPPLQHPALQRAATVPGMGGVGAMPSPGMQSPYGAMFPQSPAAPPYTAQQPPQQPPPLASPGLASPGPLGGFSNYSYATQQGGGHVAGNEYAIHQQAYRPAEGETVAKFGPKKEVRGRLEDNAGRVERGVTGMLKKFERKFG